MERLSLRGDNKNRKGDHAVGVCWERRLGHETTVNKRCADPKSVHLSFLICRNEEKPYATLTDEQRELFEKYSDSIREFHTIIDKASCLLLANH